MNVSCLAIEEHDVLEVLFNVKEKGWYSGHVGVVTGSNEVLTVSNAVDLRQLRAFVMPTRMRFSFSQAVRA